MSTFVPRTRPLAFALAFALSTSAGLAQSAVAGERPAGAPGKDSVSAAKKLNSRQVARLAPQSRDVLVALGVGADRIQDYGRFLWVELEQAQLAALSAQGVALDIEPDARKLQVTAHRFDPLFDGEPSLGPSLRAMPNAERGFRVVQFEGPTRESWLHQLAASGLKPLQYYPHNAYLVWGEDNAREALAQLDFVRWDGAFHPGYKIATDLQQRSGRIENVTIVFYNDDNTEATLDAIEDLGATVLDRHPTQPDRKFFNAVVQIDATALEAVARLDTVLWLGYAYPEPMLDDEMSDQVQAGNHPGGAPVVGYSAYLAGLGFDGSGVRWAVVDTGVDYDHPDLSPNIVDGISFPGACNPALQPGSDCAGGGHGTHVAGIIGGTAASGFADGAGFRYGLGVAPAYGIVAMNSLSGPSWPPTGGWQEHSKQAVLRDAVGTSNSWTTGEGTAHGYQASERTHDLMTHDGNFDTPALEPIITVFSAGNSGSSPNTLTAPKEAKNVIVVASSVNARVGSIDAISGFSSRGPANDGRIVPTIAAPGEQIASTRNDLGGTCATSIAGTSDRYAFCSGTSMAAPHVSGALVLATQWWRGFNAGNDPSPAMAKALLVNSAVDMGPADRPNPNEGWGRVNIDRLIDPAAPVEYWDQLQSLNAAGEGFTVTVQPANPALPVQITLAWTDAAGAIGANPALVNDLDLVVDDGGTLYRGNVFGAGWSATGGSRDAINNLENVFVQSPSGDPIEISVDAINIAGDGVWGNGDLTDQNFALVCSNCDLQPGYTLSAAPAALEVCAPDTAQASITVGQIEGYVDPVTLSLDGVPAGLSATLGSTVLTPPSGTTLSFTDTALAAPGTYPIQIDAQSTAGPKQREVTLSIFDGPADAPTLQTPAHAATGVTATPTFTWNAVAQAQTYVLEVATDPGFQNIVLDETVTGTSHASSTAFPTGTNLWWRVHADNTCGIGDTSTVFRFQTLAGPGDCAPNTQMAVVHFSDDMENGSNGWTSSGTANSWAQTAVNPSSPATSWLAGDPPIVSDQRLVSPAMVLPADAQNPTFTFMQSRNMEERNATSCWDGGLLESSVNGGSTWTQVPGSQLLTEPYTGALFDGPANGLQAWCGDVSAYRRVVVNATPWLGQTVNFRFRLSSDSSVGRSGWHVDDVQLSSCAASPPVTLQVDTVGDGDVDVAPDQPEYAAGTDVTLTATPDAGWRFVGWSGDVVASDNPLDLLLLVDSEVTATFEAKQATQTTIESIADPVRVGVANEVVVHVSGSATPPASGAVSVTASSGESCSSPAPDSVAPGAAVHTCDLVLNTLGPRTVTAAFGENDTHTASSSAAATVSALRFADLAVSADDGTTVAMPGAAASYLVEIRNAGPDEAVQVPVQIAVAPDLTTAAWSCSSVGGASCPQGSGTGDVVADVTLPSGGGVDYVVTGNYAPDLSGSVVLGAQAIPTAAAPAFTFDPELADNTSDDVNLAPTIFRNGFEN